MKNKERIIKFSKSIENADYKILGIDCSSATIGWGFILVNDTLSLKSYGHICPPDAKFSIFERLNDVFNKIDILCKELNPTHIAIEDILLFMKGNSTARTITILTAFNRVVGLSAYRNNKNILLYSVGTIRKTIKDYYELPSKIEKTQMPDIIRENLEPKFANIINKKNNINKITYDEADGVAVSLCCAIKMKGSK